MTPESGLRTPDSPTSPFRRSPAAALMVKEGVFGYNGSMAIAITGKARQQYSRSM
ncbi:hypothetical protein H6F77_06025 [Microcoleus sp. FACHB-831]|uniref:hypothetical protein n=1 Tax=Microcoleus sp. FACHB-831 TaxID=2692827 RepID=UPI0016879510|nr:hypothetical protein [Microcoleus sp. FACHB-831]MBD1920646.1 hypothetical protein [Microcoleus sp. FACHB-831]